MPIRLKRNLFAIAPKLRQFRIQVGCEHFKTLSEKQESEIEELIKNLLTQWETEEENQLLEGMLH